MAKPPSPVKVTYCLYARKSTEQEDKQVLSIDSQIKEMERMAAAENLEIAVMKKESHSAKEAGQRPVFNEIVEELKQGKYSGILTWAPDRIARNAGDLGRIVDFMDQKKLLEIRTYGQKFSNTPNDKFMLMILGSQAKLENDNKVVNVKRGLRARVEMGLWPGIAPTGYFNSKNVDKKCHVEVDPQRGPIIKRVFEKIALEGWSGRKTHTWLNEIKFKTRYGKALTLSNLYLIIRNPFYHGILEYPKGVGQFYQGKHEPLITRDLFERVQESIAEHNIKQQKNDFAFTRLMTCGLCGSGIVASEKIKRQQNGNIHEYVYYGCSKYNDKNCACGYIREDRLVEQFAELMDKIDLDEIGMKERIKTEIERHRKFQSGLLGEKPRVIKTTDIDIRNYGKHILREGGILEQREILTCLRSKIVMNNKEVRIS